MFLIGDAGPHMDYGNGLHYLDLGTEARKKGIKIYGLGCSGIEEDGEPEFKQIAQATGGTFEYLTYRHQYVDDTGGTYYRLKEGRSFYTIDSKGDEWKSGVKSAIERGMAQESAAPAACPATSGGSGGYILGKTKAREAQIENNLDAVFTNTIQQNLEASGVKYKK
jgi:hypothetical protein